MAHDDDGPRTPLDREDEEPRHLDSPTALAAEGARSGVRPPEVLPDAEPEIPGQDDLLRIGDADVDPLENAYVGEQAPGFDNPTPDQDGVDATGRAYGVSEADSGALKSSLDLAEARDRRRAFADEPDPPED
jgi:hypothetical protein